MAEFHHGDLVYATHPEVYDPSDDTWLLIESLDLFQNERFLEVGCGAGLVSVAAARYGARVYATDRNPAALALTSENARRNQVSFPRLRADLLNGIKPDRFDAIAFNPPYLPTSPEEHVPGELDHAFSGGPGGLDVTLEFLSQLARSPPPRTWLVASTLQDTVTLERAFERHGFDFTVRRRKPLSHETLLVYDLFASQK